MTDEQKERNRLWVAELRSDKYRKIRYNLRNRGRGRCCLGVACEIFAEQTGNGRWERTERREDPIRFRAGSVGQEDVPPEEVVEWFGWEGENPPMDTGDDIVSLAELNDSRTSNMGFKRIAKLIESNFQL